MNRNIMNCIKVFTAAGLMAVSIAACVKDKQLSKGAYENAPVSPVVFYGKDPLPKIAASGINVTFLVKGLKSIGDFKFFLNQVEAPVVSFTDSLIVVTVPLNASTGPGAILTADGQYFFGPNLSIEGKVYVDPDFDAGNGTDGPILDAYSDMYTGHTLVGNFTDYKGQKSSNPVNGIVKIDKSGKYVAYGAGRGVFGGSANTLLPVNANASSFLIGGSMSTYGVRSISNVTRIFGNAALDTMTINMINPEPDTKPWNSKDTVPSFNGYLMGEVVKLFRVGADQNIAVGNFNLYYNNYYIRAQKGVIQRDYTLMRNFIKLKDNGAMDSSFNFNPATGKSYEGLNGFITTGVQLASGKIMIGGLFTKFNDANVGRIAVLSPNGGIDNTYAAALGSGADNVVGKITYNKTTRKILVTGGFSEFNGHKANGIVMLNEDGTVDAGFTARAFEGGVPNFAGQLNNGKILVSGRFNKYDNHTRLGFMVLNADGSLAQGYNNTGAFSGYISGFSETTSVQGVPAVLLYGGFSTFDNKRVGNMVQINIKP